jgi:hypothetical protein
MRVGPPFTGPVDTLAPGAAGRGGRGGRGEGGGGAGGGVAGGAAGAGGGGFGGRGGTGEISFPALPGIYKARLTIVPVHGATTALEQSFALIKDPMVILTDAELRQLHLFRLAVAALQRDVRQKQARLDSAQRMLAEIRRAASADSTKAPTATRQEIAALEKELSDIVAQFGSAGGRGGFGGGGGGGGAGGGRGGRGAAAGGELGGDDQNAAPPAATGQTIQARLGTTTEILNVPFNPSQEQRKTLQSLPLELQKQSDRLDKVISQRLPALLRSLRDVGIEVKS